MKDFFEWRVIGSLEHVNRNVSHDQVLNWIVTKGTMLTKREAVALVLLLLRQFGGK